MSEPTNQAVFQRHGRDKLLNLLEECLKGAPGDQAELVLEAEQVAVTRYASNRIHQNVWENDTRVWARVLAGGAIATLACNSFDPAVIRQTLAQAATIARRQPNRGQPGFAARTNESGFNTEPGTAQLPPPPASESTAASFFETTAGQTPADRAASVGQIVEQVQSAGYQGYGTYKTTCLELAVANTAGLRAYSPATSAYLKSLVESGQGSGYADQLTRDAALLDPVAVAQAAIAKCRLNHNQIDLPPGDYAAVLEPNTVADMVRFIVMSGCGAQQLQDGLSFMTGKFGDTVTGANINLWEDPYHPMAMPFGLDYDGLHPRPLPLITAGKAAGVAYDRYSATKAPGRVSTGHAASPAFLWGSGSNPLPEHVVMQGGTASTDAMIGNLRRGLVITRLHYTHCPDPRRVVATGTTRDGTFLVENGEIVAAVKNLRFTQSILELLSTVEEFGQPRTVQDWWAANGMGNTNYFLPPLRVAKCTFTGVTTF